MNRHQKRVQIVFALYQHLLLKKDLNDCFLDNFEDADEYVLTIKEESIKTSYNFVPLKEYMS